MTSKRKRKMEFDLLKDESDSKVKTSGSDYEPPESSISDSESENLDLVENYTSTLDCLPSTSTAKEKNNMSNKNVIQQKTKKQIEYTNRESSIKPSESSISDSKSANLDLIENDTNSFDLLPSTSTTKENNMSNKNITQEKTKKQKEKNCNNSNADSSLEISINLEPIGPVLRNKKNEIVLTSDKGTKKNTCYYCLQERIKTKNPDKKIHFSKLVDHYETAHSKEAQIIELMKLPKIKVSKSGKKNITQIQREAILNGLRNKANFINNRIAKDASEYVVSRRPTKNRCNTVATYGTCYKCWKQLSLSSLHKHVAKCTVLSFKNKHAVKSSSRATLGDYSPIATEGSIRIISKIREGHVLDEIRYDNAIFHWLNAEAQKYETVIHQHDKIRANLRRLGRLKIEMKLINENIEQFSDVFHEDHYEDFIEACKILGKADPVTKYLKSSSTAQEMSYLVINVANVHHVMIGKNQKTKREAIDAFLNKVSTMWHSSIGNTIAEIQANNKRRKLVNLPTEDDVVKLRQYLEKQMKSAYMLLRVIYSDENYVKLRNSIESYLHVTICRRAGEVERLRLEDYEALQIVGNDCWIQVRGKRTKPVPIVFDKQIHTYLENLISNSKNAKISESNPYIFSNIHNVTTDYKYMSACTLMNKFSELCGAENPERLSGTLFRKQVATKGMEKGITDHLRNYQIS